MWTVERGQPRWLRSGWTAGVDFTTGESQGLRVGANQMCEAGPRHPRGLGGSTLAERSRLR
jgi:hypothetical protein